MFHENEELPESQFERALLLQNMVMALATGGAVVEILYRQIRSEFVSDPILKPLLPKFVRTCRDGGSLWAYLKSVHSGGGAYAIRGNHVTEAFEELLDHLEERSTVPSDQDVSVVLSMYNAEGVQSAWAKALKRRTNDPQGAITSARTLLEEVCKHILEDVGESGFEKWDLPKLYSATSKFLNLAPSQHSEEVFKKILGGCHTVVENIGGLRNKMGDAHAMGRRPVKPTARHAALAVNLAGSMDMFLIETWMEKSE